MIAELCNEGSKVFITSSASNSSRYIIPFLFFLYLLLPFVIFTRRNFPFFSTHRSIRFVFILQRTNGKFVEVVGYGKILSRMDETLTVLADFPFFFARFHRRLKVPFSRDGTDFQLFRVIAVIGKFFGRGSTGVL